MLIVQSELQLEAAQDFVVACHGQLTTTWHSNAILCDYKAAVLTVSYANLVVT